MQHPSAHSHTWTWTWSQPNQTAQPALLQTRRAAQPCHQGEGWQRSAAAAAAALRGQGGHPVRPARQRGPRRARRQSMPQHAASASPRLTACATAMRMNGAKRGTAHVALSSSETGTPPLERLPRSERIFTAVFIRLRVHSRRPFCSPTRPPEQTPASRACEVPQRTTWPAGRARGSRGASLGVEPRSARNPVRKRAEAVRPCMPWERAQQRPCNYGARAKHGRVHVPRRSCTASGTSWGELRRRAYAFAGRIRSRPRWRRAHRIRSRP